MDRRRVADRLRASEGCIDHMYLCTGGKVTIGVGHALETAAQALQLKWQSAGQAADTTEVQADFEKIARAKTGLAAPGYSNLTTCRLSSECIADLLEADISLFEEKLREHLPNWDTYPEPVQEALLDMAFNLGVGGLMKFKKLLSLVDARDWMAAAGECHRRGISDERNRETAELFRSVAINDVTAGKNAVV